MTLQHIHNIRKIQGVLCHVLALFTAVGALVAGPTLTGAIIIVPTGLGLALILTAMGLITAKEECRDCSFIGLFPLFVYGLLHRIKNTILWLWVDDYYSWYSESRRVPEHSKKDELEFLSRGEIISESDSITGRRLKNGKWVLTRTAHPEQCINAMRSSSDHIINERDYIKKFSAMPNKTILIGRAAIYLGNNLFRFSNTSDDGYRFTEGLENYDSMEAASRRAMADAFFSAVLSESPALRPATDAMVDTPVDYAAEKIVAAPERQEQIIDKNSTVPRDMDT